MVDTIQNILILLLFILVINVKRPVVNIRKITREELDKYFGDEDDGE